MYLNRRRFLKYAGATAAVVGASVVGYDYLLKSPASTETVTQTSMTSTTVSKPPVIRNFEWLPTRVANGKVYDVTVSFEVEGSLPITSLATLDAYAPTIPSRAYPAENPRTLQLTTTDQTATCEIFSANVTDIKGGKQYRLNVQAANSAGTASADYETPYVREFENIAGNDQFLVGAVYNPWFENPCVPGHFCHWRELQADFQNGTTPVGTPLLGLYNSNDPTVVAKHIDWATGFGIDFFIFDFWDRDSAAWRYPPLLEHPLIRDIKFALSYATPTLTGDNLEQLRNVSLSDPTVYSQVESDFEYMATSYFSHPSYLKLNGRPFVSMWHCPEALGRDLLDPLTRLRQHMHDLGFDIYFVGDALDVGATIDPKRLQPFDAISNGSGIVPLPLGPNSRMKRMSMQDARDELQRWATAAHSIGIQFVPFAYPGYDDSKLVDRASYGYTPRSPEFFSSEIDMTIDFVDKNHLLCIVEFDGWGENTQIEPSVEDGFKYLQTLRDTLAGH